MRGVTSAPNFDLFDQHGKQHTLEMYRGSWLVLYFYPKDDTPGCTREACDFRDHLGQLESLGATVLGVSADDVDSHGRFASKHDLNFALLADPEAKLARAYGAYGTKNLYGKISQGIIRQTFLIDPDGQIVKAWKRVSVDGHVAQVEAALREARAR